MFSRKLLALVLLFAFACAPIPATATPPVTVTSSPVVTVTPVPQGDGKFLPNPALTPGAYNSAVTQSTIQSTICVPGYSSSIRPPVSYTDALKVQQLANPAYGDTADQNTTNYEEDHFIPLSVGGNPTDPKNLWPQPRNTQPYNAAVKDNLEYVLYKAVCNGTVTLATAQQAIVSDWVQAYRDYVSGNLGLFFTLPFLITPEP